MSWDEGEEIVKEAFELTEEMAMYDCERRRWIRHSTCCMKCSKAGGIGGRWSVGMQHSHSTAQETG